MEKKKDENQPYETGNPIKTSAQQQEGMAKKVIKKFKSLNQ